LGFENIQSKQFYFVLFFPPSLRAVFVESEGELLFHLAFQGLTAHRIRLFPHLSGCCLMGEEFITSYGGMAGRGSAKHCL
jgi:hypothetical protein